MDDIQRKLSLIDRRLAGVSAHKKIVSTCPLLFVASGLISGIIVQHYLDLTSRFWFFLLIFSLLLSITLFIFKRNSEQNRYITAYLALLCFLCLGSLRLAGFNQPKPDNIRNFVPNEPVMATIRGYIVTAPYVSRYPDWAFAEFMPMDPGSGFYMKVTEIETASGWVKTSGKLRVSIDEPVMDLKAGDYIQAYCWLDYFKPPTNPGQYDITDFLAKNGVYISAAVESRIGIQVIKRLPSGTLTFFQTKIKELAQTALLGDLPENEESNGLLQALLLGYRGDIDSDTNEAFRRTGLSHYISLSGMHFGIIIGLIWWLSRLTGLMKPGRAVICIMAIILFLLVIPPMAPALRAAIITLLFCVSFFFRRRTNAINTLSLSAIILLLIRPTQLFEAGWQLSFASVAGIILFSKNIEYSLREATGNFIRNRPLSKSQQIKIRNIFASGFFRPNSSDKFIYGLTLVELWWIINNFPHFILLKTLVKGSVTLFSVGLAAWLASAGILLYHFHTITPLSSLWTVLVFPLVSAIMISGFIKILLFVFFPTLSLALGFIVTHLSAWLIYVVKLVAGLNISEILIGHVSLITIVILYCVIAFAVIMYHSNYKLRKPLIFAAAAIIILIPAVLKLQTNHDDELLITCLDVGHGQAIFLSFPDGRNMLFDTGSMYRSNIGTRIIIPFLEYCGINRIDEVIISHNDTDHINGIPEIVKYSEVGTVHANTDFFSRIDSWGTGSFLSECLKQLDTEIKRFDPNQLHSDKYIISMLWPEDENNYEKDLSDNDKSLVTMIEFAGVKILLCSDIEQFAQKQILSIYPDLKADIIVVPHHGSSNTLDPGFLEKVNAGILICSSDKEPSTKIKAMQKRCFYTSRNGAITTSVGKDGKITVETFNDR